MRSTRMLVVAATVVAGLVAAPAALAAGKAPAGGLFPLTGQDDIAITNLVCDDPTITEIHLVRGGIVSWVLGEPDRMYVLTSLSGDATMTTPDGSEEIAFSQYYGHKKGLDTIVACSMDYTVTYGDVTQTGVMNVTAAQVW